LTQPITQKVEKLLWKNANLSLKVNEHEVLLDAHWGCAKPH
jgi:hypothetical protein